MTEVNLCGLHVGRSNSCFPLGLHGEDEACIPIDSDDLVGKQATADGIEQLTNQYLVYIALGGIVELAEMRRE